MASIKDRRIQLSRDKDELAALRTAEGSFKSGKGNKVLRRQMATRGNVLNKRITRETAAIETAEHGTARERVLKDVNKRLAELSQGDNATLPTGFFQGMRDSSGWSTLAALYEAEVNEASNRRAAALNIAEAYEDGVFVLVRNGTGPLTVRYGRTRTAKEG